MASYITKVDVVHMHIGGHMRIHIRMTGAAILAVALIFTSSPVQATGMPEGSGSESVSQYLAAKHGVVIADKAVLNSETTVVFGANGETVQVLDNGPAYEAKSSRATSTQAVKSAAAGCSYRNASFVNASGWVDSTNGCSIIGFDSTAQWGYNWYQDMHGWNSGPSCVQGRGYSASQSVTMPVWYAAGCGGSGSVHALIGNRATVAKIRGHVNAPGTIGYVRWK